MSVPSGVENVYAKVVYAVGGQGGGSAVNPSGIVITKVGQLVNDVGYVTSGALNSYSISKFSNDAGYITIADVPAIPSAVSFFTNDAGYVTSVDVPSALSQFANDANFVTSAELDAKIAEIVFSGDIDLAAYATIDSVNALSSIYATKDELSEFITVTELDALSSIYATKEEVSDLPSRDDVVSTVRNEVGGQINDFVYSIDELSNRVTKLENAPAPTGEIDLSAYAKVEQLEEVSGNLSSKDEELVTFIDALSSELTSAYLKINALESALAMTEKASRRNEQILDRQASVLWVNALINGTDDEFSDGGDRTDDTFIVSGADRKNESQVIDYGEITNENREQTVMNEIPNYDNESSRNDNSDEVTSMGSRNINLTVFNYGDR